MNFKTNELMNLFNRVYDGTMIVDEEKNINDELDLQTYCKKIFGDGSETPDPSLVHQFNNLLVKKADKVAEQKVTDIIKLLANHQTEKRGNVVQFDLPSKRKAKFVWSANGVGVDLVRVAGKSKEIAVPRTFSTGFYYEPDDLVQDSVDGFKELVNDLADAKVRLYLIQIQKLIAQAISANKIPTSNKAVESNVTIATYNKIASILARYGGRPLFIADTLLIDHFANQLTITNMPDSYKAELAFDLNLTKLNRTDAFNLNNPFTDETNSATELSVNKGYMLAGEGKLKPFRVVEYGGMRQTSQVDFETGRVMMKIFQDASILLVFPHVLGYIEDTSVTL